MLFEDSARTRLEPLDRGEGLFEFYDSSASRGYNEFRTIVNGWLAEMPAGDRAELITRMRYGSDREFGSSLCELAVHAFLCRSGCKVILHPEVPGSTKRPDFAATDQEGKVLSYVEMTTINRPANEAAEINRENPVFNAIDAVKLPAGSILGYNLVRAGKSSPAMKPLVAEIERWARENQEAAKVGEVSKRFSAGEWTIELELYAGGTSADPSAKAVGVAAMRGGMIKPHKDLREALDKKSKRYGVLDAPYLIGVADAKDQLFGDDPVRTVLTEALMGDEIAYFINGKGHITHAKNGFWHGATGARNRHVSGVLFLPETSLWRLREQRRQPTLAINPWADRPLPGELKALVRFEADNNRWKFRDGKRFADILNLPDPWPPENS